VASQAIQQPPVASVADVVSAVEKPAETPKVMNKLFAVKQEVKVIINDLVNEKQKKIDAKLKELLVLKGMKGELKHE